MAKRERLEDFGILAEKLEKLNKSELLEMFEDRSIDLRSYYPRLSSEERDLFLHNLQRHVRDFMDEFCECILIARGHHDE